MSALTSGGVSLFASLLAKEMSRYGTRRTEVSKFCGVPEEEVEAWMRGSKVPHGNALFRLRKRFPRIQALSVDREEPMATASLAEEIATKRDNEVSAEKRNLPQGASPPREFGPALRWYRLRDGLTSADAAELVGVAESAFRQWEASRAAPVKENLAAVRSLFPDLGAAIDASLVEAPVSRDIAKPVGQSLNPASSSRPVLAVVPAASPQPANNVAAAGAAYAQAIQDLELAKLAVGSAETAVSEAKRALVCAHEHVEILERAVVATQDEISRAVAASVMAAMVKR